jgi:hypothetical protein
MDPKPDSETAKIYTDTCCKQCGWPIISACCNDEFADWGPPGSFEYAKNYDWWLYCSNKGCINHEGEGVFQNRPEWIQSK